MQKFILQQNVERFRTRLAEASNPTDRRRLRTMLSAVERELALLEASEAGVDSPPWPIGDSEGLAAERARLIAEFRGRFGASPQVAYLIDPAPGLEFVDVNPAFEQATGLSRDQVVGQALFMLFPDNPSEANADGTSHLYASLRRVASTGLPDAMPTLRYDVRDADGVFVERHWQAVNTPLSNAGGRLIFLRHTVDEVTDQVIGKRSSVG
ncbi:PAS domain-containing protein [Phenylobacterium sp.]|uniref:PAS domain-containing protein n=1 Tax=Phenylobacterium sp. TaxID=1871053 RepID=UPI00121A8BFA|nr:PAS domain-containing protein [Phenylobacterium sp.]THD58874.1 MAG: PAS domain-containing protein [Phenylobacterium sp.]